MTAEMPGHDPEPADGAYLQLGRSVSGVFYWRLHVAAKDATPDALREAAVVANEINAELVARYPHPGE